MTIDLRDTRLSRRRPIVGLLLIWVVAAFLPPNVLAGSPTHRRSGYALGGSVGAGFGTGDWADAAEKGVGATLFGEANLDLFLIDTWVRGTIGYMSWDADDVDADQTMVLVSLVHYLRPLYLLGGVGWYRTDFKARIGGPPPFGVEATSRESDVGFHLGAGKAWELTAGLTLRVEGLLHHVNHPELDSLTDNLFVVNAALAYHF